MCRRRENRREKFVWEENLPGEDLSENYSE